jgi:N-acetylglutamate synthase-like GNAT family acetyltransferase
VRHSFRSSAVDEMDKEPGPDELKHGDHWELGGDIPMGCFSIRRANVVDSADIRSLIRAVGINPLGLDWRRFMIAVGPDDQLIGCGQIKVHKDGSRELASIAVRENWRRRGVASGIIDCLLQNEKGNIWLMCRSKMVPFYAKLGFEEVPQVEELPSFFRRIHKLWVFLCSISGGKHKGSMMVKRL